MDRYIRLTAKLIKEHLNEVRGEHKHKLLDAEGTFKGVIERIYTGLIEVDGPYKVEIFYHEKKDNAIN